jgi:3D-(3,5/4)-trihydroxycyclohexane-1,2-dione acylhydrolase (decyclizing)
MGTEYRYRKNGSYSGELLEVNFEANAASIGAWTTRVKSADELRAALVRAKEQSRTCVVVVETVYDERVPDYQSWWDVPIAEVSTRESVQAARRQYENARKRERHFL